MTNSNIQLIECVTIANEDYLQSLLAVGFYGLALKASLLSLTKDLDFSNSQTKILLLDDEQPAIAKQGITINSLATAYGAGTTRFYSAIKVMEAISLLKNSSPSSKPNTSLRV